MEDWRELCQTAVIGLVFAFLVAKLISFAVAFKTDGLRLSRAAAAASPDPDPDAETEASVQAAPTEGVGGGDVADDWEGIESTELDEEFSAASSFIAASAADRMAAKVPEETQLQLYGLYKIATEGPCTAPQPSPLKMKARAKWNAWHSLGALPAEEAMERYIMIVNDLFPSWASGSTSNKKVEDYAASSSGNKGTMGPVFSSFVYEEDSSDQLDLGDIHVSAREGLNDDVVKHLENGVSVNVRDSEGRTPLHWAVDRGHLDVVETLVKANADVNATDDEGQTPLHYAVVCDREAIAELLVRHHADVRAKDNDGSTSQDLCSSQWAFMAGAN